MILDRTSLSLQTRLEAPQERVRLVRLCARLTGDRDAAEDLAQETLAEAWRHLGSLRQADAFPAWLAGIAANVCRRWQRRTAIGAARTAPFRDAADMPSAFDVMESVDRRELTELLDRVMAYLNPADREALVARYVEERPLAEIAARAGWSANTAAVRLSRSRKAMQEVLTTRFRAEAVEFGMMAASGTGWEQTRLWCFRCGRVRLEGRFAARDAAQGSPPSFAVRCPRCDAAAGDLAFSTTHPAMDAADVLGPTRGYKPAFRRVIAWWGERIERGVRDGRWECWQCSGPMTLLSPNSFDGPAAVSGHRARFRCERCAAEFTLPASGLTFHSALGQKFWQRHPRMRVAPERALLYLGRSAVLTRYEDVAGAAFLEVLYAADTFQPLQSWGDAPADARR